MIDPHEAPEGCVAIPAPGGRCDLTCCFGWRTADECVGKRPSCLGYLRKDGEDVIFAKKENEHAE